MNLIDHVTYLNQLSEPSRWYLATISSESLEYVAQTWPGYDACEVYDLIQKEAVSSSGYVSRLKPDMYWYSGTWTFTIITENQYKCLRGIYTLSDVKQII